MEYPWMIHGLSMENPWVIHGLSMEHPWIIHGQSIDSPWIIHGESMDDPWIIHRLCGGSPSKGPFSWALVSNLGVLKFQIFRFSILEIFLFWKICWEIMLVRYRGINNKGVLERPWTKWRVLRAISTTLKCQFTGKC